MKSFTRFRGRESKLFHMPQSSVTFLVVSSFLFGLAIILVLLHSTQ